MTSASPRKLNQLATDGHLNDQPNACIIPSEFKLRKRSNCLTKNLLEMDSLPQIRNLLEMSEISSAAKVSGGVKDEVNDEGKKADRGGHGRALPAGAGEREKRKL